MKTKKVLLPFILLILVQQALAQPLQRKVVQNETEFSLSYTFASDSLKGFFEITEDVTGSIKLLNAVCKIPYRFENGRLQISGDKIPTGSTASFKFKLQDETVSLSGFFRSENFGLVPYEMELETVRFQKPVVLAASSEQRTGNTTSVQEEARKQPLPVVEPKQETVNNLPGTANPLPVSFRVQLAASVSRMDKQKLQQLSGLALPVQEDHIDGFYKYTIGNEKSLQEAQVLLNKVSVDNFKKPFIVAYRQNERIPLQQALMEINRPHP